MTKCKRPVELMTPEQKQKKAQTLLRSVDSASGIHKLLNLMTALRDPVGGCPWDLQQDYQSVLPYTIEEVYEVAQAIENKDFDSLKDELGDLLFQVIFYAQIAKEEQRFEFEDIIESVCSKLISRHPHVFSNQTFDDENQMSDAWEALKHQERQAKSIPLSSVLDDIPIVLPELKRADKIQKRVAKVGFDWPDVSYVWDKIAEESLEVKEAVEEGDPTHIEEELGDLMFALVNLTRHYGFDADMALRKANIKFEKRFRQVESQSIKPLSECTLDELEALWTSAKK
jgi:nucleoside triphosphate diphosphatase